MRIPKKVQNVITKFLLINNHKHSTIIKACGANFYFKFITSYNQFENFDWLPYLGYKLN